MGIINRVASKLGYQKSAVGPLIDDGRIFRSLRELLNSSATVKKPYKQSVWVYSCINTIAENMSRVPFLLRKDEGDVEPGIVESGPLYELFQNPNPMMTQEELLRSTVGYYCLRGEAFWIMEGRENVTELPKEIWTFDPIRFEPVQDKKTGFLIGWKYRGLKDVYFSTNEVIQFKTFNPYDDFRGLSPLEAGQLSVDQEYHASVYNKASLRMELLLGGFISVPDELSDDSFKRLVDQFESRHKGSNRAHKIAVVEGGGKFTPARMTQKDMDFMEGKRATREEIMAIYKVNEVVLGIYKDIKSYEGIKSAHKAYWEECLMPKLLYIENVLWSRFFSKLGQRRGKGRVWGKFDLANVGPLQVNYSEKIETAGKMFTMGWPINMINRRLELGMEDVPWGNEWWVPGGFLPVTALVSSSKNSNQNADSSQNNPPTKLVSDLLVMKKFYCEAAESDFKNKFKKVLFEHRKRCISATFGELPWSSVLREQEFTRLTESVGGIYTTVLNSGVASVQRGFGQDMDFGPSLSFINSYKRDRSVIVVGAFRSLVEQAVSSLEDGRDGDVVRELFNFLSVKLNALSSFEVNEAFDFGRNSALSLLRGSLSTSLISN